MIVVSAARETHETVWGVRIEYHRMCWDPSREPYWDSHTGYTVLGWLGDLRVRRALGIYVASPLYEVCSRDDSRAFHKGH